MEASRAVHLKVYSLLNIIVLNSLNTSLCENVLLWPQNLAELAAAFCVLSSVYKVTSRYIVHVKCRTMLAHSSRPRNVVKEAHHYVLAGQQSLQRNGCSSAPVFLFFSQYKRHSEAPSRSYGDIRIKYAPYIARQHIMINLSRSITVKGMCGNEFVLFWRKGAACLDFGAPKICAQKDPAISSGWTLHDTPDS